jgi:hypothetical protein
LIPPLSFHAADEMRTAIGKSGYKTLTFTRPGFDREAKDPGGVLHTASFPKKVQYFMLLFSGIKNERQNAAQRLLAAERAADIRFILGELQKDGPLKTAAGGYDSLFLLGYGAGGAAAVELAGDRAALDAYPELRAAAAVESIFLCDFEKPPAGENDMDEAKGFFWFRNRLFTFFSAPALQLTNIAHPEIPVLFIAGDGAQAKKKKERYIAVVQTMLESPAPFLFASVDGAHEIDFSTFANQYPVAPFFLKSSLPREEIENAWPREEITARSAEYISTFFRRAKEGNSVSALRAALESAALSNTAGNTSAVFLQTSELK